MKRNTIVAVVITALSGAAVAQVGTDTIDNKLPASQLPSGSATPAAVSVTDDAPPSVLTDAPAPTARHVTPVPDSSTNASGPPPKR